ncbi:hypothetical protein M5K25_000049 [Dendrobium thyrsiflorum]|uniref:Uncharacterized protein n=1 Tax=Dendrobium thyrsiflorum TaxID=117978 RepID=A0ABD0VSU5_DENTH
MDFRRNLQGPPPRKPSLSLLSPRNLSLLPSNPNQAYLCALENPTILYNVYRIADRAFRWTRFLFGIGSPALRTLRSATTGFINSSAYCEEQISRPEKQIENFRVYFSSSSRGSLLLGICFLHRGSSIFSMSSARVSSPDGDPRFAASLVPSDDASRFREVIFLYILCIP